MQQSSRIPAGAAEQAGEKSRLAVGVEITDFEAAQGQDHFAERRAGRPDVLDPDPFQHPVGNLGQLFLRAGAEEHHRVGVLQLQLGQQRRQILLGKLRRRQLVGRRFPGRRLHRGQSPSVGMTMLSSFTGYPY